MNDNSINDSNNLSDHNDKNNHNYNYFKLLYIITTVIITFLGVLIIFEEYKILTNQENKSEIFILYYIIYSTISWLIIFLLSYLINFLSNFILKHEGNFDKNRLIEENSKEINRNNISHNNLDNNPFERNINRNISNTKNSINKTYLKEHDELYYIFNFPISERLRFIFVLLLFLNYIMISILGILFLNKILNEEIFKNYKLHYKIYLFILLSVCKSSIIIICIVYKFINTKIESNSTKFELNEEFIKQVEREIQEANRISGIIQPDRNLIHYNEMFNRQSMFDISLTNKDRKSPFNKTGQLELSAASHKNEYKKNNKNNVNESNEYILHRPNTVNSSNLNSVDYITCKVPHFSNMEKTDEHFVNDKFKSSCDLNKNILKNNFEKQNNEEKFTNKKSYSNNILDNQFIFSNTEKIDIEKLEPSKNLFFSFKFLRI